MGREPRQVQGNNGSNWIVLDYSDVVIRRSHGKQDYQQKEYICGAEQYAHIPCYTTDQEYAKICKGMITLEKYDYLSIEKKWQKYWEEHNTFKAETGSSKPKFYALVEFPYPSGHGMHV